MASLMRQLLLSRPAQLRQYCSAVSTPSPGSQVAPPVETSKEDQIFSNVDIELRAHQPDVLESYNWFATTAARHLNVGSY